MFVFFKGWGDAPPVPVVTDTSDVLTRRRKRKDKRREQLEEEHYAAQVLKERQKAAQEVAALLQPEPIEVKPEPAAIRDPAVDAAVVAASLNLAAIKAAEILAEQEQQRQAAAVAELIALEAARQQKIAKLKKSSLSALMLFVSMSDDE